MLLFPELKPVGNALEGVKDRHVAFDVLLSEVLLQVQVLQALSIFVESHYLDAFVRDSHLDIDPVAEWHRYGTCVELIEVALGVDVDAERDGRVPPEGETARLLKQVVALTADSGVGRVAVRAVVADPEGQSVSKSSLLVFQRVKLNLLPAKGNTVFDCRQLHQLLRQRGAKWDNPAWLCKNLRLFVAHWLCMLVTEVIAPFVLRIVELVVGSDPEIERLFFMLLILDPIRVDEGHGVPELAIVAREAVRVSIAVHVVEAARQVGPSVLHGWVLAFGLQGVDPDIAVLVFGAVVVPIVRRKCQVHPGLEIRQVRQAELQVIATRVAHYVRVLSGSASD